MPPLGGNWKQGSFVVTGNGGDFRVDKPADAASPADWWATQGEHIYSRKYSQDWPLVLRFHHDALEADMIGYCEGLGLILWAFQPREFLRRADHLQVGPDRTVNGRTFATLVATPDWLVRPLFLENRTSFPFCHSTMCSWAEHKPVVTYFVDAEKGMIAGAEFVYMTCLRDSDRDWHAGGKPSGLSIVCLAAELGRTPTGGFFPASIVAEVLEKDAVVRRSTLTVSLADAEVAWTPVVLPATKRAIDAWPSYRVEVYEERIRQGDLDHANLLGLARALAFERDVRRGMDVLLEAVTNLQKDPALTPAAFAGIDWDYGFVVYDLLRYGSPADVAELWSRVPRTRTWADIVNRGIDLYHRFLPEEKEAHAALTETFQREFLDAERVAEERAALETYARVLRARAASARTDAMRLRLEKLAGEVEIAK